VKYTDEDLERAEQFLLLAAANRETIAQLIADVRYDTLETAAVVVERFDEQATNQNYIQSRKHMARRIRALRDEP
jgi:hypothetical protein